MTTGKSREDLFKFLDYLAEKGLIPAATARARKASSKQVLAILDDDEASDVLALDLDLLMHRFSTKNGQQYNPNSVRDYASRLRSSIDDFRSYTANPLGFRLPGRNRKPSAAENTVRQPNKKAISHEPAGNRPAQLSQQHSAAAQLNILPIPLRADLIVQIAGLPFDLTPTEARKIANIIIAHASEQ